ncbi:polymorphic outer membrane protein [Chloroflexus aggregans DSM 9485]|uniref:Polymorphic outer membrane protein n=2 Tax=Chloroflexus aggregans TaxID=152260 RepID=B8G8C2_CHLAD|nr:polymorphic outer membrane protein [Chloroflexus aggregans DSM 9485]
MRDGGAIAIRDARRVDVTDSHFANNTAGSATLRASGGAIWAVKADYTPADPPLTITAGTFTANYAWDRGGAIFAQWYATVIAQSRFTENGSDYDGGAISMSMGSLVIRDSELTQNRSVSYGGAIYAYIHDHTLTVTNTVFRGNECDGDGGAIWKRRGHARIEASRFIENRTGGFGGGLKVTVGTTDVIGSEFRGNTARLGGGIHSDTETLTVRASSFVANTARLGGGIANDTFGHGGSARIETTTFVRNAATVGDEREADALPPVGSGDEDPPPVGSGDEDPLPFGSGGALFNTATLEVVAATLHENTAERQGGGIFSATKSDNPPSRLTVVNTIITGSPHGGDCVSFSPVDGHHTIIGTPTAACGLSESPLIGIDPRLGELTGDPPYLPLLPDSPAIDAGDSTMCPGPGQNGVPRPVGSACDIGAVEWTADTDPPTLTAVACITDPPAGTSVQFRVVFSEAVRDVDATDLVVEASPASTPATITDLTARSAAEYLVTVGEYGSDTETLTLAIASTATITDLAGHPLVPPSAMTGGRCAVGRSPSTPDRQIFLPLIVR